MRVIVMIKANPQSEAGAMPNAHLLQDMADYSDALAAAGILLAGEGLHPSHCGVRVRFDGTQRQVVAGPFPPTRDLMAGFWLWQVRSMDEALEWVRRCPHPHDQHTEIEIRPVFEAWECGDAPGTCDTHASDPQAAINVRH
jgi:hypothetical protein